MLPSPSAGISSGIPTPASAGTKRPAASDLHRTAGLHQATPSKRHATTKASAVAGPHTMPALAVSSVAAGVGAPVATMLPLGGLPNSSQPTSQQPMLVTEDQLVGRTPEQLIATILQIQSQHQQYVATISAQYNNITQQLDDLRGSLATLYSAQASQFQTAASQLQGSPQGYAESRPSRPVAPPAPMLSQQSPPGPPRAQAPHAAPRPARPPPQSPNSHADARLLPKQPSLQAPQTPGPPAYDYRTVGTVEEVWREYREGIDGQPAVEELDATWGSRWRPEPRGRTWYSRRKVIWDKIKEYIAEGMEQDEAVREVEKLRDGGTINKLIRMLQDERKDKGVAEDSAAA